VAAEGFQGNAQCAGLDGKPLEDVPARDQGERGLGRGDQGSNLALLQGIVEQYEQRPAVSDRPEECRPAVLVARNLLSGYVERTQELLEYLAGRGDVPFREAAQVGVELPVGELVSNRVAPVDCKRGLTHTAHSAHGGNRRLIGLLAPFQDGVKDTQSLRPITEVRDPSRHLTWHRQRSCVRLPDPEPVDDPDLHDTVRATREAGVHTHVPGVGDAASRRVRLPRSCYRSQGIGSAGRRSEAGHRSRAASGTCVPRIRHDHWAAPAAGAVALPPAHGHQPPIVVNPPEV
jgi:hypothetical protein